MQFKINERGQAGETMTWIVATIVIVVMIVMFLFVVNLIAQTKIPSFSSTGVKKNDLGTEEMLIGILNYKSGNETVNQMINSAEYDKVTASVTSLLASFSLNGVSCNFYVYDSYSTKVNIENNKNPSKYSLEGEKEALKC